MISLAKIGAGALLASVTIASSACATRPMLEDVVPYTTIDIANKIRCDARQAVLTQLFDYLKNYQNFAIANGDPTLSPSILRLVEQKSLGITEIKFTDLPKEPRERLRRFSKAAIIYDFQFEIQEQNNLGSSIGYNDPFSLSRVFGSVSSQSDRTRKNKRNFRLEDNFETLIRKPPDACKPAYRSNGQSGKSGSAYPITDDLNFAETIGSFWYLTNYGNLVSLSDGTLTSTKDEADDYSRLVDEITFTTKLSGTVNPQFEDTGQIETFRLTPVSLTATNLREDIHKLVFALAMPAIGTTGGTSAGASKAAQQAADTFIVREDLGVLNRQLRGAIR